MAKVEKQDQAALARELQTIYAANKLTAVMPGEAIDNPWQVVRLVVTDSLRYYMLATGKTPRKIYLPKSVEAALEIDRGRTFGEHRKLRTLTTLYGMTPVFDAEEFKLE